MTCLGRTFSLTGRRVGVVAASLLAWSCGAGGSVTGPDPVPDPFAAAVVDEPGDVTTSAAKVAVCHLQGSTFKQLSITTTSLRAHMAHGDKLPVNGSCATPPATCPCFTVAQIDSTQCPTSSGAIAPLCPQQISERYGVPVVEGIGWSCESGQQSGFYIVYDAGGFSCSSLSPFGETNVSLNSAQVDACLATIRSSQLYRTAACGI